MAEPIKKNVDTNLWLTRNTWRINHIYWNPTI